jgi:hypothetical protein
LTDGFRRAGCTHAWSDLEPRSACGCTCVGTWYKTISYRLQYQISRDGPFVNLPGAAKLFGTTFTATGLTTGSEYGFRIFVRGLNGVGPQIEGSNVVYARPLGVPQLPAAATLVSTYRAGESAIVGTATITWQDIDYPGTRKDVTAYKVQISLDGETFVNTLSYEARGSTYTVGLPEVPALAADIAPGGRNTVIETLSDSGEFRITTYTVIVENLRIGTRYWLRVVARNANLAAYTQSPPSNVMDLVMSGAPPPILNLEVGRVEACMQVSCGCSCCGNGGTNTCDGVAQVTIKWNNPVGSFTISKFQISAFLDSVLAVEEEVLPTPAFLADSDYTLGADGQEIPGAITEEHTIGGLLLHKQYSLRVTARNANVEGYRYPAYLEVMPADLPSVSVEDTLKVTRVTASELVLQWRPVVSQPVSFYKVDLDVSPTFSSLGPDTFFGEEMEIVMAADVLVVALVWK